MVGDFNYNPLRRGTETEVDREVRMFVEEMRLQDVSYSGAPGPSHYPAPGGSTPSQKDAVYADPRWVKGVTAGYMVRPDEMQDRKGHCLMMVTVDVKVGEPGDDEEDEQGPDEEGVSLLPRVKWPEEGDERWQQWGQQVHVQMRKGSHVHQAMRGAARVCGFNKQEGKSQAQPKLQRLVATLRKRQYEEVKARAQAEGAEWQTEVTQAKKRVRAARRAVEEEYERIYQKVVAEHERYMVGAVPYKSLRYIRELAEAGKPQEIQAVRLRHGRVTGNKREVLEEVAQSFSRQHNQEQQELSGITRRMMGALPRVFTADQSEDIYRSRVTLGEIKEAVQALKRKKSPGVDQLVAEAYQHLEAPELDSLAGRVTEVLRTDEPRAEWGGKVQPLYKKGDHLRPGNWRPICHAVREAKLVWMVIPGRIQRRLYAARIIPDNMWGSVPGRSTQEASFLYNMYLDDEDLEAFMASVDLKGAFPNTPHRLIEEVWRQLGLQYGDLVEKYLRSRRNTVDTGKGCTEWVTPGRGVPQGGAEGPFLYLLAMLPLMSWIAREYLQLPRAPQTSPAQAYVDDAVPMARDEKAQQVVQKLMQRYRRKNHLVWSTEKSTVLRRGGEEGVALDVGDRVAWLERAEEAVVLGCVQAMEAGGFRLPDKLLRRFRVMLVVLQHHPPSVQTMLYYLRAVLNVVIGYQGMHLRYCREQLEEVEGEVQRLIRGYEGIPTEVPWCVMRSPTAYYGEGKPTAGEAYRAHTARTLSRMCHNQEEMVRRVCYQAVPEVQKEENMCLRYVWHRRRRSAARKKERMWRVLQAVLPGEEHMLATNRTCGRQRPVLVLDTDFGGAAYGTVQSFRKEGVSMEVLHVRRKDMKEYKKAGLHHAEFYRDARMVEWCVQKWIVRRARGQEDRARWGRRMRKM